MICRSLKFFLRALDFAFFECFYYMKAIPFSMNLATKIGSEVVYFDKQVFNAS